MGSSDDRRDKGAALALAMYEALYDSTGYGHQLGGSSFAVTGGLGSGDGSVQSYYDTYLASLSGFKVNEDIYGGYVLKGDSLVEGQNGQEFILIGTPVPEPATLIAGALLLLPFGTSTIRLIRRTRKA